MLAIWRQRRERFRRHRFGRRLGHWLRRWLGCGHVDNRLRLQLEGIESAAGHDGLGFAGASLATGCSIAAAAGSRLAAMLWMSDAEGFRDVRQLRRCERVAAGFGVSTEEVAGAEIVGASGVVAGWGDARAAADPGWAVDPADAACPAARDRHVWRSRRKYGGLRSADGDLCRRCPDWSRLTTGVPYTAGLCHHLIGNHRG